MLKMLRNKKTAKKIWILLAILVLPPFVLWGTGNLGREKKESPYAGKIFGRKISLLDYKDAMEAVKNLAIIQYGDDLSKIQKYLNLESQAWDRLILLNEAKRRKIKISDREVIQVVQTYPFFQKKGRFDEQIYSEMLRYVFRTQARAFEEQTRQNIILAKLYNQVTAGVSVSDEETKEEYRKANEELSICYVAGLISDFQKDNTASEDELKDYFAKNSLEFKKPLSFNLEYVSADSEDKIRSTYDRLGKKEDFAKVAKELGLEIKETGLFGQTDSIPGLGWLPEISGLIIKLNTGDFLPPMKVDKNYCIFRLKERKEPYIPDFETSKDKVRQVVIKNKARQTAQGKMQACLKYLKDIYRQAPNKEIDFEKIGKELGLKSASTGAFKYGSYIEGLGASDDFWEAARALKEKEFSDLIATPLGFYIIKTKSRTPLDEGKFAQDKPAFAQRLLELKKQESFAKFLTELKKKTQLY